MCLSICALLWTAPSFGGKAVFVDMKKCPPAPFHALGSLRYDALLWVAIIMSLARYKMIASRFVAA